MLAKLVGRVQGFPSRGIFLVLTLLALVSVTSGCAGLTSSNAKPQTPPPPPPSSLAIMTSSLPAGQTGAAYQGALAASGGSTPFTWSLSTGTLPTGLSLSASSGAISGTPSATGQATFTVSVTDNSSPPQTTTKSLTLTVSASTGLDQYGGVVGVVSPNGGTGFFRVEETTTNHRWVLVDPMGNYFWMFSVYYLDLVDGGTKYANAVQAKYPSGVWQQQEVLRLKSWGFKTIGPGYATGSHNVLPVPTFNLPANPQKMPFIRKLDLGNWCMGSSTYVVKNLYNGTNSAVFFLGRDFPDVFDSQWTACVNYFGANGGGEFSPPISQTEPWMVGTWIGDSDYLYGFGRGPSTPGGSHPHLGWVAAITSPTQTTGPGGTTGRGPFTYTDTVVHTKVQWQAYLQAKYGTIAALNAAWGSTYTTFSSSGGWPKKTTGGTGLMDEDGSSPWMGNGSSGLTGANANAKVDMDAFLAQIADQFYKTAVGGVKAAFPSHLVFGPGSLNAQTYSQVLQKAGQYLDVLEVWVEPIYISGLVNAYNTSGKPMIVWTTLMSQQDSSTNSGAPWGTGACTGDYDFCTQDLRGQGYANLVQNYWNTQATDGSYPVLGFNWWQFTDNMNEGVNFGLVDVLDNAYNGLEDRIATGIDPWGYPTGGETINHGDFLTSLQNQNLAILQALLSIR